MGTEQYYAQSLEKVWSPASYAKYENARWEWWNFPFSDLICTKSPKFEKITKRIEEKKILEVGSAMGGAYAFLKSSNLVDVSQYTGIEISNMGYLRSRERFPEARWIQTDFTRYDLKEEFDYSFERHAVHHMPNPLVQYQKLARNTRISLQFLFRGRLVGETISDLELARFSSDTGLFYLIILNLFDVVKIGLDEGFNHIHVLYCGDHEPIDSNPEAAVFVSSNIQKSGGKIKRFAIRMSRCPGSHRPILSGSAKYWKHRFSPQALELRRRLTQFSRQL